MSFKRVDECLPAWLRAEIEMMKSGATEAAPSSGTKVGGDRPSPHKRPVLQVISNSRCFDTALPRRAPHRGAVSKHLVLVWSDGHAALANSPNNSTAFALYAEVASSTVGKEPR